MFSAFGNFMLKLLTDKRKNENMNQPQLNLPLENNTNVPIISWRNQGNQVASQIKTSLEHQRNVPQNSWRSQGHVATANLSGLTKNTSELKQAQITPKDEDNFWMPAVDTKHKHSDDKKTTQLSLAPQDCNEGTQLLKSMLGLSSQSAPTEPRVNVRYPRHALNVVD